MYYVYILQSLKDNSLYIGYSPDLRKRLVKHNKKQVISTRDKTPWKLIYYEAYLERKDATGREVFLKSGAGWRFIKKQLKHYFEKNQRPGDQILYRPLCTLGMSLAIVLQN